MKDVKLHYYGNTDIFDISFKDGDIEMEESFNTPIIISLFSDARADPSEVRRPENRRGFWGDEVSDDPNDPLGSKLWLLDQARMTSNILLYAKEYARLCLQWLIKNEYSKLINVTVKQISIDTIQLGIQIINNNNIVEQKYYNVWLNTGNFAGNRSKPLPPPEAIFMIDDDGEYMLDQDGNKIELG